jgi:hypothetical protein
MGKGKEKEVVGMISIIFRDRARGLIYNCKPRRFHPSQHFVKLTEPDLISSHNYGSTPAEDHEYPCQQLCQLPSLISDTFAQALPESHQGLGKSRQRLDPGCRSVQSGA